MRRDFGPDALIAAEAAPASTSHVPYENRQEQLLPRKTARLFSCLYVNIAGFPVAEFAGSS